jgi:hypothetical protein
MWRSSLIVVAAAIAGAGCTGDYTEPTTEPVAPTAPAATANTSPSGPVGEVADNTQAAPTPASQPLEPEPTSGIEVATGALPRDVRDAIRRSGGELATSAAWVDRFAPLGFPIVAGPGVHLVEADVEVTRTASGWRRVDAMQWLFVDGALGGVASTLDRLAASIDVAGWDRLDDSAVIDAAPCVTRTYTTVRSDDSWILQGCDFPLYPGMVSVGIIHSTTPPSSSEPPPIDPSVAAVVAEVDGTIEHVSARFGPPVTVDSTVTLVTAVTVTPGPGDTAGQLATTALTGWARSPGEANSTVFVGAPGQAWTVTPTTVRYSSQGRLAP